jgi:hypothetical protein
MFMFQVVDITPIHVLCFSLPSNTSVPFLIDRAKSDLQKKMVYAKYMLNNCYFVLTESKANKAKMVFMLKKDLDE